jgi:dTDP-4-dehydrorhamnose reductase
MTGNVVLGANGLIGSSLMRYLGDAVGTWHNSKDNLSSDRCYEYLDITEKTAVESFFDKHRPKRVFIAAYNPNVDACENSNTDKVNIYGMTNIISCCDVFNSLAVFFSSPYVFSGESQVAYKPHDETFPIQRYGRQKEQVEKILRGREGLGYLIIRTTGVFGNDKKNFAHQVRKALSEKNKITVPTDQILNPVHAMDVAKTTIHLSDRYSGEIFHVAGNKCLSKYEWAIKIAYKMGVKQPHKVVRGATTEKLDQFANRPLNGCLDCKSLEARAIQIPDFEKGLHRFIEKDVSVSQRAS